MSYDHAQLYARSKAYLNNEVSARPPVQAKELGVLLRYHEWRYYVQDDPVLSDKEYDELFKMLEALEAADPHPDRAGQPHATGRFRT